MARKVKDGANVAWLREDHPNATDGAGYYIVEQDNEYTTNLDENGDAAGVEIGNAEVKFGKKVDWVKANPDPEGEPANSDNNEGYFVYVDGSDDGEGEE